jgi:ADP-heptose:LPS heptosyltransferase
VVLAGGVQDKDLSEHVLFLMANPALDLTGALTLGQSAAVFAKSTVVIANDGGPLHVAVSVGTPTVSIFGPVDEAVYGPYPAEGHRIVCSDIACRPCYRRFRAAKCAHRSCLRDLSVDRVFEAVKEIL